MGRINRMSPASPKVLTTGGGLVFNNGDLIGILPAFDASTGKVLWSFNTGSGCAAASSATPSLASSNIWCQAGGVFEPLQTCFRRCSPNSRKTACGFDLDRL